MRISSDGKVEALRRVRLFSHCTRRELTVLAGLCAPLSFKPGRVLAREGTSGQEWLVISDGLARVTLDGRTTGFVGPGDSVGDVALLRRCRHPLTVTAETSLGAYVFTPLEFWSVLELCPKVRAGLGAAVVDRPGHGSDRPLVSHA
jgi:CRP/FNR family cyclic AMP-dependent transcriptional regulator